MAEITKLSADKALNKLRQADAPQSRSSRHEQQIEALDAGRYIVTQPGTAEPAFAVIDEYQGQGIGTFLLKHLVIVARESGVRQLIAEVLPENAPMLAMFRKFGFLANRRSGSVHVVLDLGRSDHSRE